jgi:hypothetical protein
VLVNAGFDYETRGVVKKDGFDLQNGDSSSTKETPFSLIYVATTRTMQVLVKFDSKMVVR